MVCLSFSGIHGLRRDICFLIYVIMIWYIKIEGGTHAWPEVSTSGINTSEVILGFFSRFVK